MFLFGLLDSYKCVCEIISSTDSGGPAVGAVSIYNGGEVVRLLGSDPVRNTTCGGGNLLLKH